MAGGYAVCGQLKGKGKTKMSEESKNTGLKLKLVGEDGNAWAIIGRGARVLRKNGMGDKVEAFQTECLSGSYQHLLATCMEWFDCE